MEDKIERIYKAATNEFADKGYDLASTNQMVKQAGVSKGLLFHHFKDKYTLFKMTYEYNYDIYMKDILPKLKAMPTDIFERWLAFLKLKAKLKEDYPNSYEYMAMILYEESPLIKGFKEELAKRKVPEFLDVFYQGIDRNKFKEDVDPKVALNMIYYVISGWGSSYQSRPIGSIDEAFLKQVFEEYEVYRKLLVQALYKEEFQ